jgi:signal peptidase I
MRKATKAQWIKFSIISVTYLAFTIWVGNYWLLIGLPFIFDIYISKIIPWGAWKKIKNPATRKVAEWIDTIIFALIAVYIINLFVFQNYKIPSSSLEKTLLVGDFLFVSKMSYGPRVPNTPLSFPLAQHTIPVLNCKSYSDWPNWPYHRLKGFGNVERGDIVVFNFPAGDTVAIKVQNPDYYTLCKERGRDVVNSNKVVFGNIIYRPVDRRENYVKRCVGMPGDSLQIIENQVYINGEKAVNPKEMQLNYFVEANGMFSEKQLRSLNISIEDRVLVNNTDLLEMLGFEPDSVTKIFNPVYHFPLTQEARDKMLKSGWAKKIIVEPDIWGGYTYPLNYNTNWTRDNYGPIWIPKKGETIVLNQYNLALYSRCIVNYEGNKMRIEGDNVYLNGQAANSYTFKYDYYFMMGDNRHKSADSRSWGFVPEDHIVGKPILVWLSLDKDRKIFDGWVRWKRLFKLVDNK